MTVTLLILALIPAANPFRAVAARSDRTNRRVVGVAIAATWVLVVAATAISGPLLDLVDVTGPSARIAAGVALLAVCAKDLFATPPTAEPALPGWKAGLVPLAFPVIFSPAVALLAIAGAAERGVAVTVIAAAAPLAVVAIALLAAPTRGTRPALSALAALGVGIAALVVLDGVYAI